MLKGAFKSVCAHDKKRTRLALERHRPADTWTIQLSLMQRTGARRAFLSQLLQRLKNAVGTVVQMLAQTLLRNATPTCLGTIWVAMSDCDYKHGKATQKDLWSTNARSRYL
ncbi:hypothetical protein A6R70_00035 [Agrobacterium rubi]|nr:hypothetical protein [Agrobacterium rubi]